MDYKPNRDNVTNTPSESDETKKPAPEPGWDLREAENDITAAVGGNPALAMGLRRYSEAGRNMLQTLLVPSFERAVDAISEKHTVRILGEVALRLDEILASAQLGVSIGREALAVGREAKAIGLEALAVGREALTVSKSNSTRLAHVEKAVIALKKGQTASNEQLKKFAADIAELRSQIATLGLVAEKANALTAETNRLAMETNRIAEEHNRLTAQTAEHEQRLAEIEAWRLSFERSSG